MWHLRRSPRLLVLMTLLWLQDCTQQQVLHHSSSIVLRPQLFTTVATAVGYAAARLVFLCTCLMQYSC